MTMSNQLRPNLRWFLSFLMVQRYATIGIGERWHQWKQPVTSAAIQTIRTETAGRKTPRTPEELKALGKQKTRQYDAS